MPIGKMIKHKKMLRHPELSQHLPETYWLTSAKALRMMKSYSSIFIKPNHGSGGSGIIRAKKVRNGYEVRCGRKRKVVDSRSLYKAIVSYRKPSQRYLVQRGLKLARYNGTIFDARIYMQKPEGKWIISGMAARVAAPRLFVTNYLKGGHAEELPKVLSYLFKKNKSKVNETLKKIKALSSDIAETLEETLQKSYPGGIPELGIDLGIEKNGRIWIIEANSKPGHMLFTQIPDKTMFNRIMKNKRLMRRRKGEYE